MRINIYAFNKTATAAAAEAATALTIYVHEKNANSL
jgi:hypothetical protein